MSSDRIIEPRPGFSSSAGDDLIAFITADPRVSAPKPHRIINLHGVGEIRRTIPEGERAVWIDTPSFHDILDSVAGRDDVALTFDDGNRSDLEVALPALLDRGLRATFFVCAGRLADSDFLGPDDVRALAGAGMGIGSHGWTHVPWRGLGDAALRRETIDARSALEDVISGPIATAALPFGAYDRRVLRSVRDAGFSAIYSSDRGPGSSRWLRPRTTIRAGADGRSVRSMLDAPVPMHRRVDLAMRRLVKGLR